VRVKGKLFLLAASAVCAAATDVRFLQFPEAREILVAFDRAEDASAWDTWVRSQDREVRARIERGVEDSISNLILYGASFTRLPRLESAETALTPAGELVEAARARVRAAAAAMIHPAANERLQFARDFLERRGVRPENREAFLAANLLRFVREQRAYQEKLNRASQGGDPGRTLFVRATLFDQRGLSVDTSLLPNYAIEDTLRVMLRKGALVPGHIRRIAVIGPGLDFTDKRDGYDFYPLQTIQPFAVIEAVIRLGLGRLEDMRLVTFDLNPAVNAHLKRLGEQARKGRTCVIQLPRDESAGWTPEAISYWECLGGRIGAPVPPAAAPRGLTVRAVAVASDYAALIEPVDLNVVTQVLETAPGTGFDLVVATNILVYYDRFQQALAMAGIARMMNSGGAFLSNTVLPAQRPAALEFLGRRSVSYSSSGAYGDDIVAYRRK
jgi:hypothetical protein